MTNKKIRGISIAVVVIVTAIVVSLFVYHRPESLFPFNQTYFEIDSSSTIGSHANSNVELDHLYFQSQMENLRPSHLMFHSHDLSRSIDISKFDHLKITTTPFAKNRFTVMIYLYVPGISVEGDLKTHRPYAFICSTDSLKSTFEIPLKELATPIQWFDQMHLRQETLPPSDWKRMTHLAISDWAYPGVTPEKKIEISSIRFECAPCIAVAKTICAMSFAGVLTFILFKFRRRHTNKIVKERIYGPVQELITVADTNRILDYLKENYGDTMLTMEKVTAETGLNSYQVNLIIRDCFGIGYKQYLNSLRMHEAKRLLRDSELSIATIGERVGYLHANSFARTFRAIEGIAPKEFRQSTPS